MALQSEVCTRLPYFILVVCLLTFVFFLKGVAPRPSLPKLLALDKDFSDLDEQLNSAARIIGLPQHWHREKSTNKLRRINDVSFNPRAEWVLRWLLDKLKSA